MIAQQGNLKVLSSQNCPSKHWCNSPKWPFFIPTKIIIFIHLSFHKRIWGYWNSISDSMEFWNPSMATFFCHPNETNQSHHQTKHPSVLGPATLIKVDIFIQIIVKGLFVGSLQCSCGAGIQQFPTLELQQTWQPSQPWDQPTNDQRLTISRSAWGSKLHGILKGTVGPWEGNKGETGVRSIRNSMKFPCFCWKTSVKRHEDLEFKWRCTSKKHLNQVTENWNFYTGFLDPSTCPGVMPRHWPTLHRQPPNSGHDLGQHWIPMDSPCLQFMSCWWEVQPSNTQKPWAIHLCNDGHQQARC